MDSRAYFEGISRACERLEVLTRIINSGGIERDIPRSGGRSGLSDPTASLACSLLEVVERARAERVRATDEVGEALEVIAGVRVGLGETYAAILELRYIDREPWWCVRETLGLSRSTGYRKLDVAFDWMDSHGLERVRMMARGLVDGSL